MSVNAEQITKSDGGVWSDAKMVEKAVQNYFHFKTICHKSDTVKEEIICISTRKMNCTLAIR